MKEIIISILVSIITTGITYFFTTFIIEDRTKYNELRGLTFKVLKLYSNEYRKPLSLGEDESEYCEAKNNLREIGIEWGVFRICRHLKKFGWIPSNDKLQKVYDNLLEISNISFEHITTEQGREDIKRINELLEETKRILNISDI